MAAGGRMPASVMYPYRIPGHVYRSNETHYHTELFDSAKFNLRSLRHLLRGLFPAHVQDIAAPR